MNDWQITGIFLLPVIAFIVYCLYKEQNDKKREAANQRRSIRDSKRAASSSIKVVEGKRERYNDN